MEWIHLETVSSTNSYLKRWVSERPHEQEIAVVADFQSHGKGRGGHSWTSDPGENLLMSVLLYPEFLSASAQFFLSMASGLALCGLLGEELPEPAIKWPNDILVGGKKIAGILIENSIMGGVLSHTVIGFGLNVNQGRFPSFPWSATSLTLETGKKYHLQKLAGALADHLLARVELLRKGGEEALRKAYLDHLYRLDRPARYLAEGREFTGIARGISEYGELMVESSGQLRAYGMDALQMLPRE